MATDDPNVTVDRKREKELLDEAFGSVFFLDGEPKVEPDTEKDDD